MKAFLLSCRVAVITLLVCLHIPCAFASDSGSNSLYFAVDKPFVVNLSGSNTLTYLQVNVQFKLKSAKYRTLLQMQMPAIKNALVLLLSDQTQSEIRSVQGKQALRKAALKSVQQVCQKLIGNPAIDDVYFTGFIIQ